MKRFSTHWLVIGALIAIALLIANVTLTYRNTESLYQEAVVVAHTHDVLRGLDNVLSLARDAETGERGYIITGDERYLEPYNAAVKRINIQADEIAFLTADNPRQQVRIPELRSRIAAKLSQFNRTIDLRRRSGPDAARAVALTGQGKVEMDELLSVVGEMIAYEQKLRSEQLERRDQTFRMTIGEGLLSGIFTLVAIIAFLLLRHQLAERSGTALVIAEQAERLRTTLGSIGDGVIAIDSDGRVTLMNAVAESLTGWTFAGAAGLPLTTVFDIINEKTGDIVENPGMRALQEGVSVGLADHTILLTKGGGEVSIDDSASPIRSRKGEMLGAVLVFRDISERRQSEQTLVESEEKYRKLFDSIDEGFCIVDVIFNERKKAVDFRFVETSQSFEKQTGISNAVGKTMNEIVPNFEKYWFKTFGNIALTGIPARFENRAEAVSRWFDVYAFRFGKPESRQVAVLFKDITSRKQDESRIALLARLGEITRTIEEPEELLFAVATAVGTNFNARRCLFNEIDLDNDLERVHRGYFRNVKSVTGTHKISEYSNLTLSEMQAGRTVVYRDSQIDPRTAEFYEKTYAVSGERSYVAVPLMRGGQWVASLRISDDEPRNWSGEDVRIVESIGERSWLAVERLRSETGLRESEVNFRTLANSMSQLAWMTDADGYVFWYNERWFEFTGTTLDEMQGWGWQSVLHPAAVKGATKKFTQHIGSGEEWEDTFLLKSKTGEYRWFLSRAVPIRNADGEIVRWFGTNTDVNEVRKAEEILQRSRQELETRVVERTLELAKVNEALMEEQEQRLLIERDRIRLLNQLVTTQEDERSRIARDLHDELGQQVTALRLKLENAKEICNEEPVCDEIDATQSLAERLDADIGFLAWELRPASLAESGLAATLTAYVKEWSRFTSIAAELHTKDFETVKLLPTVDINLYRIVQEALNNVSKYAEAKNVSILLEKRGTDISLIIEDDGRGFDLDHEQADKSGLGLIGMSERAALLEGTLEIESSGTGTTIFMRIPFEINSRRKSRA
ncbi:MAG: CHASE3 domain-containing protein [Pyrinomonadaceae bacterium]